MLVLQAIGLMVNKPDDMDEIGDKVNDALNAPDKDGVDLAQVRAAQAAVDEGSMGQARVLLQQSLQGVPMEAATGEETGTTVVHDPLNLRGQFAGRDWVLLAISALALLLGVWLAVRYRPHESVRVLRHRLATAPPLSEAPIRRQGG